MSKTKRKKRKARTTFNAQTKGMKDPMLRLNAVLNGRNFQSAHYEIAKKYMQEYTTALVDSFIDTIEDVMVLTPPSKKQARNLRFYSVGFHTENIDEPTQESNSNKFVYPTYHRILMQPDFLWVKKRRLPIRYSYDLTDFRIWEKTGKSAEYQDQRMKDAFVLGLALCHTLSTRMEDEKLAYIPTVIPTDEGLFLAIVRKHPSTICPMTESVKSQGSRNSTITEKRFEEFDCELDIRTFFPISKLNEEQKTLQQEMLKLLGADYKDARECFWWTFAGSTASEYQKDKKNAEPFVQKLEEILDMPEWQVVHQMGKDHIIDWDLRK